MKEAVWLLLEAADGQAELFSCATCTRPESHCAVCPIEDQPDLLSEASWYLRLYGRVQKYQVMPDAGGILDQDEVTMELLDLVDGTVERYREYRKHADHGKHGG